MRWLRLFVLWSAVCVQLVRCDRDACDLDDPTLKKLCRKVESQEKYQEKWVATNFKAETVIVVVDDKWNCLHISIITDIVNGPVLF